MPATVSGVDTFLFVAGSIAGVTGHVVLETGRGSLGSDSIAVWHVDATGHPAGAWIVTVDALVEDAVAAQRLLGLVQQRSVLCWNTASATHVLDQLAKLARMVPPADWESFAVRLPDALAEIAEQRALHTEAVAAYRKNTKSKVEPLVWPTDVPADVSSLQDLRIAAGLAKPAADSEVAERALLIARLAWYVVGLWEESEQVRQRRRYLREAFGPESPLPPRWLGQLRAAHSAVAR